MIYGYQQKEAIYEEYEGSYTEDSDTKSVSKEYGWNHGLGEVINALIEAGLTIDYLKEHEESPYDIYPDLEKSETGMYVLKDRLYPLVFEIRAHK